MVKKSRHCRDESDPLLGLYSQSIAQTSSTRYYGNPLHNVPPISPSKKQTRTTKVLEHDDYDPEHARAQFKAMKEAGPEDSEHHKPEKIGYRVHRVSYTAQNHVQILFKMYGSAFPQVLPFCVVNVCWTLVVFYMKSHNIMDWTFHSSTGHSFMGLLVSFLVVSRSKISYDRFMEIRRLLATSYRSCREIAQLMAVYTQHVKTEKAAQWRQEVGFRTILLLRVTMDALLWSSTERDSWEEEYFKYKYEYETDSNVSEHFYRMKKLSHGRRSMIDENFRAPVQFSHILRQVIMEHPDYLGFKMPVNEYRDLVLLVSKFIEAFHGFRVLVFTPCK